jgi:hypothetical protein
MVLPNAGGNSSISEALSMQYMFQKYGTCHFVAEMEIEYWILGKMCDYLLVLKDENIGVSVTRAVKYPFDIEFTYEDAEMLLHRKLFGLISARNCVSDKHAFYRSILHVWCLSYNTASYVKTAFEQLDNTYDNISVICTICTSMYVYTNRTD